MTIVYASKPHVLGSLPLDRHAVIEASAGTGKTYALEHLVIEILLTTDCTLDRILVVTFTEKAAAELRGRLRKKITSLIESRDTTKPEGDVWVIDDDARRKLSRALLSFDGASISTIHAFCQRVLAENAFESGRHFEQELIDGRSAFERAFYGVLRTRIARDERDRRFLDAWLSSHTLDGLTQLLWEAHERRGRFDPRYDESALLESLRILSKMELTPHTLRPAMKRARMPPPTAHALLERFAALHQALEELHRTDDLPKLLERLEAEERRKPFLGYAIEKLDEHVSEEGKLAELRIALADLARGLVGLESAVCQRFLPLVRAELSAAKAKRGELDFDDMLVLLEESLSGASGPGMIRALRKRFGYALIDEFQDTDEVQWAIFSKVFLEAEGRPILYVIGDPKQAIYGFRGADVHAYLEAKRQIGERDGHTVHLTESFRATERLVEALNLVLDDSATPPIFDGEIRYDHPVTCARPESPGIEIDGRPTTPIHVFDVAPNGQQFTRLVHARRTHARAIAETIEVLLDPARTRFGTEPLDAKEIFVLTRSAREGLEVAETLRAKDLPYAFYKQDGLFQTREAADIRDLLAAIADPHEESHRLRAWQSPFFAVPLERLSALRSIPGGHRLMKLLLDWKALADEKRFERLYASVLDQTGLIERELFLRSSERELTNYLHVFEVLIEEANRFGVNTSELLAALDALISGRRSPPGEDGNAQRIESERPAVQIMTKHKAKGLEAAVVFLYGGLDEPFGRVHIHHDGHERLLHVGPRRPGAAVREGEEENQRLIYVAMTRAKARLYLAYYEPGALKREGGAHHLLNRRLEQIFVDGIDASLFSRERVDQREARHLEVVPQVRAEDRLATWTLPPDVSRPLVPAPDLQGLKDAHIGFDVTSYSRIKAEKGGYHPPEGSLEDEIAADVDARASDEDRLPNGPATGRFLHEMIELVPLDAIEGAAGSVDLFAARRDVRALFTDGLARYDLDIEHLVESIDLVYTGLTSPVVLGTDTLQSLASADRIVREMEFLYPQDDNTFVKGFIDVVFEHDGRVYVLDWKSDLLPSYDSATIDEHVARNYAVQAELYSKAIVRLLGLSDKTSYEATFGGAVYCFLRGMTNDGRRGIYFTRPLFEVVAS